MITIIQSISGTYFSSNVPDVEFSIGGNRAMVTMAIDDEQIYQEYLYPLAGVITLAELDRLLTPYAQEASEGEAEDADCRTGCRQRDHHVYQ